MLLCTNYVFLSEIADHNYKKETIPSDSLFISPSVFCPFRCYCFLNLFPSLLREILRFSAAHTNAASASQSTKRSLMNTFCSLVILYPPLCKSTGLLAEVSLQKTCECLAVSCLVSCHFMRMILFAPHSLGNETILRDTLISSTFNSLTTSYCRC